jgi:lycopene cyclase domain-containing protein
MEFNNFAYLLVLLGTVATPLFFGFNKKLHFFSNFKYLLPAMLFSGAIFIILDLRFTERAVWSFNPEYLIGKNLLNLPVEEWLYFLAVPLLGTFIYEFIKQRFYNFERPNLFLAVSLVLLLVFGVAGYLSKQKVYSFFIFFLLTIYLGYTIFRSRFKEHYTKFYLSYFILLIPFIAISGTLTALPIIEYNPQFNLGIRLYSIPIENFASLFFLQLMNITIYEYLKERRIY